MFTIPLQSDVKKYMAERHPEWPAPFVEWYAGKFWNHYQAGGWKLSSNVAMKDWKAAFNSNWQELKYEAKDKLAEYQKNQPGIALSIQAMFDNYKKGMIDRKGMADSYKGLRALGLLRFTADELNKLVSDAGNDKEYGRYLSVKLYFTKLIEAEKQTV